MSEATITDGKVVSFHYTLTGDDGEVIDKSHGEPLAYLHGAGNIVPGLERELVGLAPGASKKVAVAPADAYGERSDMPPQAVPRAQFPPDAQLSPGMALRAQGPDEQPLMLWIVDVSDEAVMVDLNHPLAGKTLHFDVEIAAIRDASEEEKAHGHPHGPGGHNH